MNKKYFLLALSTLFSLSAAAEQSDTLTQVVVTGTRTTITTHKMPFTVSVVDREQLAETQRVNILPTLTENIPGLFVTSRAMMGYGVSTGAAGGMSLRGISSGTGQLLVLVDGHPQYNGIYGHSIADAYQTMTAERVEVLRGPGSMLYGSNAMGGVINIITRSMKEDGIRTHINLGAGSYGTIQSEVSNEVRCGRFNSTVAAQYSRTDNHRPNMGFEQYGGFAKVGYDLSNTFKLFADVNLTHFNSSYPGATTKPMLEADQFITRGSATIALDDNFGWTNGRTSVYTSFGRHKINDGYVVGKTPQTRLFRSKDMILGVSKYQNFYLGKSRLTAGFDYQHIYGNAYYTSRSTGEILNTSNKQSGREHMNEVAVYLDYNQALTSWLNVDAGIRYDYHSVSGSEWIPQVGLIAKPTKSSELKLSASKGFRNPTMKDMYLYPPSNTDLKPERLWNYELAWTHSVCNNRVKYGVNIFYINGDNMIQTINKVNVNTGKIQNYGAEADLTWKINNNFSLTTNHSYLHMKYHVVAAPQYKGYVGASMRCGKWSADLGIQQISGLFTNVGTDNDPTESFTLVNATVSYRALPWLKLWTRGENLLAQKYEINLGYPMPLATFMAGVNINI